MSDLLLDDERDWSTRGKALPVSTAVERHLDGSDYERGELEALRAETDNQTRLISKLVGLLYDFDVLPEEAVLNELLDHRFEPHKDELV